MTTLLMAMDRASVRRRDANGFLHVEISNISKANVCPYYGAEIPGHEQLGLEPDRIYYLYRDPEELARGAHTANNVPILSEHMPVDCDDLPEELIIGSTGTDAAFAFPYLTNSLVIWSSADQQDIESAAKKELSGGYRYRADMTSGTSPEGLHFDGVMRDIMFNHVALVIEGRAGPDVVVGDEVMKLKSRTALMISGALSALIRPRLAADAKVDIAPALEGIDAKSFAMDGAPAKLAKKIAAAVKPHLAEDKSIDADEITGFLSGITPLALDEDKIEEAEDEDPEDDPRPKEEAEDEDDDDGEGKQAMDAATVRQMIAAAETRGAQRVAAIDTAKRDVFPHVGEVIGLDSAEAIYKFALDAKGIDTKGVHASAFKAMVAMIPAEAQPLALDRAPAVEGKLAKIIPNLPPRVTV